MLDDHIYGGKKRKPVTLDGVTGKIIQFPARPAAKKKSRSGIGSGASGDFSTTDLPAGYVMDPIFGIPMADPSGVLQGGGFATQPADAALAIGTDVTDAVKSAADFLVNGLKYVAYGVAIVGAVVVIAEGSKLSRDAFGRRRA